jgi:hypothetical protein
VARIVCEELPGSGLETADLVVAADVFTYLNAFQKE